MIDEQQAFPMARESHRQYIKGMTLRDYFAAKALNSVYTTAMEDANNGSGIFSYPDWRVGLAIDAYKMADAMMEARGNK